MEPDISEARNVLNLAFPTIERRRSFASSKLIIITTLTTEPLNKFGAMPLKSPEIPSSFTVVTTAWNAFR